MKDFFKFISIIPYLKNMIELKKSLGGMSDQIPAQLLPGTKNPNLIIFSKKRCGITIGHYASSPLPFF